jgi:RimJ/RimL family protein N-acetyltransferase
MAKLTESHSSRIHMREAAEQDLPAVAAMISATGELELISGETGRELPLETLRQWMHSSVYSAVIEEAQTSDVVTFATISRNEIALPPNEVEICHLLVDPAVRRRHLGTEMVLHLMNVAKERGFERMIGRTNPTNVASQRMFAALGWQPFEHARAEFVWYERSLQHASVSSAGAEAQPLR